MRESRLFHTSLSVAPFLIYTASMQTRHEHNGLVWIDLESPNRDEVQDIINKFGISKLVAEELLLPSTKPRVELDKEYAYLVLHFPALRHSHRTREQEVDFIVGRNFLVTARYDTVDSLHNFSKVFDVNAILDRGAIGDHAGHLFFFMLKKLYRTVEHEVEYVKHHLTVIEEHIYSGHETEMVSAISAGARDLLNLRQVIEPHREILRDLESEGLKLFGQEFMPYLRTLSDEYYRVHNHIMRSTDSLHELRETNNSLLSTRENETMRVLTIMALLTFPLSLMVAILSINSPDNPLQNTHHDFWIMLGAVVFAGSCMIFYFKKKKWL